MSRGKDERRSQTQPTSGEDFHFSSSRRTKRAPNAGRSSRSPVKVPQLYHKSVTVACALRRISSLNATLNLTGSFAPRKEGSDGRRVNPSMWAI